MQTPETIITIFYAYDDTDQAWKNGLEKVLSVRRNDITINHLHRDVILPGSAKSEVEKYIDQADIIFLLLSSDFLSGHMNSREMVYIENTYRNLAVRPQNMPRIVPIRVRPAMYNKDTPFADLKAIPANGRTLRERGGPDTAWTQATIDEIYAVIADFIATGPKTQKGPQQGLPDIPRPTPFFTGRATMLTELRALFTRPQTTTITHKQALYGLPGVGKTQLAAKYVDQYKANYTHTFWVNASTRDKLIEDYVRIAHYLVLRGRHDNDQNKVVQAVKQWLETSKESWLLVMDGADKLDIAQPFIPEQISGHLLLTTLDQNLGELAEKIEIEAMNPKESVNLLLRRAGKIAAAGSASTAHSDDREYARRIVKDLGNLPLAIDQAGAYIEAARSVTLKNYLLLYQNRTKILDERGAQSRGHPIPVTKTFLLAFKEIKRSKTQAADLLRLCAFLYHDAISEELLTEYLARYSTVPASQPVSRADIIYMLGEASKELVKYSLIHHQNHPETFTIHQLVQAILREIAMEKDEQRLWAERAIYTIGALFPKMEAHNLNTASWPICERLFPHVKKAAELITTYQLISFEASRLLNDAATFQTERGQYPSALPFYQQALSLRQTRDERRAQTLYHLGRLHTRLGEYVKAGEYLGQALAIQEQTPDEHRSDRALTLRALAELSRTLGNAPNAERYNEEAEKIERGPQPQTPHGPQPNEDDVSQDTPDPGAQRENPLERARKFHERGEAARKRGDLANALTYFQQARKLREKYDKDNLDTASTWHAMAEVYEQQRKMADAEKLYKQALTVRQAKLGLGNPHTATTMYRLARFYRIRHDTVEAEHFYNQALSTFKRKLGLNYPFTLKIQRELASFYQEQGRLPEAIDLYRLNLESGYQTLKPNDPAILRDLRALLAISSPDEQEQIYREAFDHRAKELGINHTATEQCLQQLLQLYRDHHKNEKIIPLYRHTFDLRGSAMTEDDLASLERFKQNVLDLEVLYDQSDLLDEKIRLYNDAVRKCSDTLGPADRLTMEYLYKRQEALAQKRSGGNSTLADENETSEEKATEPLKKVSLRKEGTIQGSPYLPETRPAAKPETIQEREKTLQQKLVRSYKTADFDDPARVKVRNELVQFYEDHDRLDLAEQVYQVDIAYCHIHFALPSPRLIECVNDLISFYLLHKHYKPAIYAMEDLLQMEPLSEEPVPQDYMLAVIRTKTNQALLNQRLPKNKYKMAEAVQWLEEALQLSETHFGKEHPETVAVRQHYISFLYITGHTVQAIALANTTTMKEAEQEQNHDDEMEETDQEQDLDDEELLAPPTE